VVIQSRRFDISDYIASAQKSIETLTNDLLKSQGMEYLKFVTELAEMSNIMAKNFYVTIPMLATAVAEEKKGGFLSGITGMFKKKPAAASQGMTPERLATFKGQLQQRADLVIGGLSGMGLKGHVLEQAELVKLFNSLYNPVIPVQQKSTT